MDGKVYFMHMEIKKSGLTILISDKINLKTKPTVRDKEGENNDKGNNPTRGYDSCLMHPT